MTNEERLTAMGWNLLPAVGQTTASALMESARWAAIALHEDTKLQANFKYQTGMTQMQLIDFINLFSGIKP